MTPDLSQSQSQKQERSAKVIANLVRKVIAAQSYGTMFTEGMNFQKLGYGMKPVNGKSSFSTLAHLDKLSKHYLQEIKEKTSNLNPQEVHLLAKIIDCKMTFRHQTNACLTRNGKLNIYSNHKIEKSDLSTHKKTDCKDKIKLSNHDFVFFGVEFSEDKNQMPLSRKHQQADYGAMAYLLDNEYAHGYLTLTDHYHNTMPPTYEIEDQEFVSKFPQGSEDSYRTVHAGKDEKDVPIFNSKDMKLGLGLHVVDFLRQTSDESLKQFAFKEDLNSKELHRLINVLFQPEFHVPRMVSTTNYTEVKLREITLQEAIQSSNFERLDEVLTTKEEIFEAMRLAIVKQKTDVIVHLFEKHSFTRDDIPLIVSDEYRYDVPYLLLDHGTGIDILRLFLEKGLIDANTTFTKVGAGRTMLEHATTNNTNEAAELLRSFKSTTGIE